METPPHIYRLLMTIILGRALSRLLTMTIQRMQDGADTTHTLQNTVAQIDGTEVHTAMMMSTALMINEATNMSEHKAYDDLKSKLTTITETNNQEGTRAAIALAYLEIVSYKDRSKASRISMLEKVAHIMEGHENRTE